MTAPPAATRRWLAGAGAVAAVAGAAAAIAAAPGSPSSDASAAAESVVLPVAAAPASPPAAPVTARPAAAPPELRVLVRGRDPFQPLDTPAGSVDGVQAVLTRVLLRGGRGDEVRLVQQALADHGWRGAVDGVYGARTAAAVAGFQRQRGLATDGVVGPLTWAALRPAGQG